MDQKKKAPKTTWKQRRRIQRIHAIRLANADFFYALDPDLSAHMLNISPEEAFRARKNPVYDERLNQLENEEMGQLRRTMKEDTDKLRLALQAKVPRAMEVLDEALWSGDMNVAVRAAQEVLDRDGRMPKVSRLQTAPADENTMPDVEPKLLAEFLPTSKPN